MCDLISAINAVPRVTTKLNDAQRACGDLREIAIRNLENVRQLQAENARLTAAHEAAADELARVTQELREAVSGRKDAISQAIMDWNLSAPPFPYLNEHAIVDLITVATTALDYAYEK